MTTQDRGLKRPCTTPAQVAELVDALASGASVRMDVEVRVLSWAPHLQTKYLKIFYKKVSELILSTLQSTFWIFRNTNNTPNQMPTTLMNPGSASRLCNPHKLSRKSREPSAIFSKDNDATELLCSFAKLLKT